MDTLPWIVSRSFFQLKQLFTAKTLFWLFKENKGNLNPINNTHLLFLCGTSLDIICLLWKKVLMDITTYLVIELILFLNCGKSHCQPITQYFSVEALISPVKTSSLYIFQLQKSSCLYFKKVHSSHPNQVIISHKLNGLFHVTTQNRIKLNL